MAREHEPYSRLRVEMKRGAALRFDGGGGKDATWVVVPVAEDDVASARVAAALDPAAPRPERGRLVRFRSNAYVMTGASGGGEKASAKGGTKGGASCGTRGGGNGSGDGDVWWLASSGTGIVSVLSSGPCGDPNSASAAPSARGSVEVWTTWLAEAVPSRFYGQQPLAPTPLVPAPTPVPAVVPTAVPAAWGPAALSMDGRTTALTEAEVRALPSVRRLHQTQPNLT